MLGFVDFLHENDSPFSKENHPHHDLWKHAVPAIQNINNGKVIAGKRGNTHEDLLRKIHSDIDKALDTHDTGYYHTKTKKFHPKTENDMDSTDLMTNIQRTKYMMGRN